MLFTRYRWAQRIGLPTWVLFSLYGLNLLGSELNLWYHVHDYANSDAAFYFEEARKTIHTMANQPLQLLADMLFNWGDWHGRLNFLDPANTPYWSNLGSLFNGKFMLLATFLSNEHLMVTPVFYTAAFFAGQLLLYKTLCEIQPARKGVLLVAVFLLPSVLFWCQGIHKDGWMMMAFGILLYGMHRWVITKQWRYIGIVLAALVFSLLVRYFYILLLLPALLLWVVALGATRPLRVFGIGYAIFFLLLLVCSYWLPFLNPMPLLLSKQSAFLALQGRTSFELPALTHSVWSLFQLLPHALWHVLITPPVNTQSLLAQVLVCAESVAILCCWIGMCWRLPTSVWQQAMYVFIMAYAISAYLLIGLTIPNTGALVRYRSEYLLAISAVLVSVSRSPLVAIIEEKISPIIWPSTTRI